MIDLSVSRAPVPRKAGESAAAGAICLFHRDLLLMRAPDCASVRLELIRNAEDDEDAKAILISLQSSIL
jgi:hypothetical protein